MEHHWEIFPLIGAIERTMSCILAFDATVNLFQESTLRLISIPTPKGIEEKPPKVPKEYRKYPQRNTGNSPKGIKEYVFCSS